MTEVTRRENAFRAGCLPVLSSGITLAESGDGTTRTYPAVEVDVTERPDVADLPRVHAFEGPGRVRTRARLLRRSPWPWSTARARRLLRLDVEVTSPVTCTFAMVLDVERHRELLDQVVTARSLVVATSPPRSEATVNWLALSLDGEAIAALLD